MSLAATSLPAMAAPAAEAPAAEPANSMTVGLMRFSGDEAIASDVRSYIQSEFEGAGYQIRGVAMDIDTAAKKVKCRQVDDSCLGKIAKWLAKGKAEVPYGYLVYGSAAPADSGQLTKITIFDLNAKAPVKTFEASFSSDDYILPIALPRSMVKAVKEAKTPAPELTEEEKQILAELDEGAAKTPEELRAEQQAIADAGKSVDDMPTDAIDTSGIEVDLKKDFKTFCREEPRKKRESRDDPPDLRPACKRGTFWGYWQPRAWVALGLTATGALATGILYGAGLGARGPYKDAVSALDSSGLSNTDPLQGDAYTDLAADVAAKGNTMRRYFLGGDIALGATVLLAGVLGIIIYQDRTDAKRFIKTEKSLKAISKTKIQDFSISPMLGATVQGAGLGFRF
ncbi:MAG: hypothetical protein KC486_32675 [Myxococcales bacterium]|nr:hypothetical protein [Myxococcales bacterium]